MHGLSLLALAIAFSSAVGITMKTATTRNLNFGQFMATNYLVCTVSLLACGAWRPLGQYSMFTLTLGVLVGFLYVICLWLFHQAIDAGGLALSTTLMRLSSALPTLGSLMLFSENASLQQMLGIFLAFICLPLASKEPLNLSRAGRETRKGMIWGLLLFAVYGLTDFTFKIQVELEPSSDPGAYMVIIFGTALLLTSPLFVKGTRLSRDCLIWGVLLGAANVLTTYFRIRTLAELPGSIAFPTLGLGVIAVTTVASLLIWREKLRPVNYVFLVLASVSVVLINLG